MNIFMELDFFPRIIKYDSGVRIKLKFLPYGFKNVVNVVGGMLRIDLK